MATQEMGTHTLVLYRSSDRADATLHALRQRYGGEAGRVTVVVLAREEPGQNGCCDTRSAMWNEMCRVLAKEELAKASRTLEGRAGIELEVLPVPARKVVDAITRAAVARGADEIVLADPRGSGLGGRERRRLRRRSPIPVRAAAVAA